MKHIVAQVAGIVLLVLGLQGGIRLLSDNTDAGLLAGLPGDMSLKLAVYVIVAVAGGILASQSYKTAHSTKK